MSEIEWYERIQAHMAEGQFFLAYDAYREAASTQAPSLRLSLLGALSLLRSGAEAEARKLMGSLSGRLLSTEEREQRFADALHSAVAQQADAAGFAGAARELLALFDAQGRQGGHGGEADTPEVLRLLSQIRVELWARLGDAADLEQAALSAAAAFRLSDSLADGVDAAGLAAMRGELAAARTLAASLQTRWAAQPEPPAADAARAGPWWLQGAELALLLGDTPALEARLAQAARLQPRHLPSVVACLRRIRLLAQSGFAVPDTLPALLPPPRVVVFAGQALDAPWDDSPCFPPALEDTVARAIASELDALGAEVGFSCASAGAELLFVEAMLDRGADVHLFLPFDREDFIRHRVAYAGGHWERRFRNACKLATSVSFATEEPFLGHAALLRFNNHLIQGMARAQASLQQAEPSLLVLWDYAAASDAGSTADFIDNWPEIERLRLIDLDELRERASAEGLPAPRQIPAPALPDSSVVVLPQRRISTMLFADIVGYSKLGEAELPALWESLATVKPLLAGPASALRLIESWGDAIYAVMDTSLAMADYAFALIDAIGAMHASGSPLSRPLQVRIGLHAGPVFAGEHPLTGRPIVYGSHVSRAARLEPVSLPGHVYASQQFVAMLLAEENALRHEAQMTGGDYRPRYACEYVGMLSLAKNYGRQPVYHLRRLG
ncbi:adenylate/guanylate cyclase domain-containing protein [Chitinilyticum litopenaei]|uniref:adenylate/guanylate cyclase domain-containing protein n=1 Tax=Chitinilyticum litopenaei TaxID=1121276 RepID=UPI0003F839C3|nr:adenylate/guanylate cyclase domain-containing protein [Chitinilyticum litopenaei]